ncbi:MAG: FxsA family protein, partial [Acidimicrobiia bacterium]|nr:FxsA family protein [Acidimicrobiia bacterium]
SLPILEVAALMVVGGALGGYRTLAILFLLSVAGLYVFKLRVAQLAARSFQATDVEGIPRTVGSAMLAVLGAALLILPGFVTAIVGIALQFSPLRAAFAHRVTSRFSTTVGTVGTRFGMQGSFGRFGPEGFGANRGDVIDTDLAADPTDRPPSPSSSPELT